MIDGSYREVIRELRDARNPCSRLRHVDDEPVAGRGAFLPARCGCLALSRDGGHDKARSMSSSRSSPSFALEDELKPSDKLDLNLGVRLEQYKYNLQNTNTPEFNYWFNATAQVVCYDPGTGHRSSRRSV